MHVSTVVMACQLSLLVKSVVLKNYSFKNMSYDLTSSQLFDHFIMFFEFEESSRIKWIEFDSSGSKWIELD